MHPVRRRLLEPSLSICCWPPSAGKFVDLSDLDLLLIAVRNTHARCSVAARATSPALSALIRVLPCSLQQMVSLWFAYRSLPKNTPSLCLVLKPETPLTPHRRTQIAG